MMKIFVVVNFKFFLLSKIQSFTFCYFHVYIFLVRKFSSDFSRDCFQSKKKKKKIELIR